MTNNDWEIFKKTVQQQKFDKKNLKKKHNFSKMEYKKFDEERFDLITPAEKLNNNLEKNTLKKIKDGKIRISARLDLHGYTLIESEKKVADFIIHNFSIGKRLLLIITGKGERLSVSQGWKGTGKLKENVPIWLNSLFLNKYILWHDKAPPEKGGEGAIMIYLRKEFKE